MKSGIAKLVAYNVNVLGLRKELECEMCYWNLYPQRKRFKNVMSKVRRDGKLGLEMNEAHQLFMLVENTAKVPGDIAEVGVYSGGSAEVICEAKGEKTLHLFDTFEGLPEDSEHDEDFHKGQFACSYLEVQNYLSRHNSVKLHKGLFPKDTCHEVADCNFSFVHLDLDLFKGTKESLEFFYPRLNTGGVMLTHDYLFLDGVRKAFDGFFADKREPVILVSGMQGTQAMIVKTSPERPDTSSATMYKTS